MDGASDDKRRWDLAEVFTAKGLMDTPSKSLPTRLERLVRCARTGAVTFGIGDGGSSLARLKAMHGSIRLGHMLRKGSGDELRIHTGVHKVAIRRRYVG
jgi:hypothetical protein